MNLKNFEYVYFEGLNKGLRESLEDIYKIDKEDVDDVFTTSEAEISKIKNNNQYTYIVLDFSEYREGDRKFQIKKIHCFIFAKTFILINEQNYKLVQSYNKYFSNLVKPYYSSWQAFYIFLNYCIANSTRILDKFRSSIEYIEERIFDSVQRDLILEIQILKRNLINFETNLLPLQTIIEDLVLKHSQFLDSFGIEKMDDSMNKIKKMTSSINNFKEQAAMLTETNEAMIARSTNQTVKALTTLSIIFLIPSIIAGFFGMNVNFGWGLEEFNFWVLLGIILSILVSVFAAYLIFKKLKWI